MNSTVFAVFTRGTDYEDNEELYALYHNKEDAEVQAQKLREEVDEDYHIGDLLYEEVEVYELKVR